MNRKRLFHDLYDNLSAKRIILISILSVLVFGILYYFNQVKISLQDREEKYARLYAESIRFFIEKNGNDCDYTFVSEVLSANETVPTILVTNGKESGYLNIPELEDSTRKWKPKEREQFIYAKIAEMSEEHKPIQFAIGKSSGYVYFSNSTIVKQLSYFPHILIATFLLFGAFAYIAYSSSRKAEQNRVWVGLAKETAHQLGTPISGLMAWVEVLKINPDFDASIGDEMLKDIDRLETITNRFSSIGSVPAMKDENVPDIIENTISYLKKRISTKINWSFTNNLKEDYITKVNKNLFEWVIENLCKNAVDSMVGVGNLDISINEYGKNNIRIDIKDTGKGMNKATQRQIFKPGFSTKKRGWGLGLTLAKRIIETYHEGQIFVYESSVGNGTTFRIII